LSQFIGPHENINRLPGAIISNRPEIELGRDRRPGTSPIFELARKWSVFFQHHKAPSRSEIVENAIQIFSWLKQEHYLYDESIAFPQTSLMENH
jgi:hypothetical protein